MPSPLIEACLGVRLLLEYHPYRFPAALLLVALISGLLLALMLRPPQDD